MTPSVRRIGLVTGVTGYIGNLLVDRLLADGWSVRVLTRSPHKLAAHPWSDRVEVVIGDAADPDDLRRALEGVDVAWYLLHSMGQPGSFVDHDRHLAQEFAAAARDAGVHRLVYLGGLHPEGPLSDHLASRVEVGEILLASGVPTAALQAGVVLGEGSASFAMLRALSERLPGAIAPRWLLNKIQPIGIDDILHYLVAAADLPAEVNRTFDVGGPEVLSYADMMKRYAHVVGHRRRLIVTAPVTTPRLAARWMGLATPVSTALATPLIASLLHDTVVKERDIDAYIPPPAGGLLGFDEAVRRAAARSDPHRWRRTLGTTALAVVTTAVVGSLATTPQGPWYSSLKKPSWQPPGWAFPLVWTPLYTDITLISALTLADKAADPADQTRFARALAVNLVLNAGWSVVFWRSKKLPLAAAWAIVLAASSADLVRRAGAQDLEKGVVLAPYAAWCAFAAALSTDIARRNR